MKPAYDYYLKVDEKYYYFPIKVDREGSYYLIGSTLFRESVIASSIDQAYEKFESKLLFTVNNLHLSGELWKIFPEAENPLEAQTCRLVAYPYVPKWKKVLNKCLNRFLAVRRG